MTQQTIVTDKAPAPIGPYSQAIRANGFIFTAGQIGVNPKTGELVTGGIEAETRQVMENLKAVLEAAGSSLAKVVRATVYLADLGDFQKMNEVYGQYVGESRPARSTIQAAKLPRTCRVEIDLLALA